MAIFRSKKTMDLTKGSIAKKILAFSLPILLGNLFQTLYNNVDALVVGNFVGKEALAAVNTCTPVANLLVGFFVGMSTGASVLFSKSFGAGDYPKLKDAIHTTLLFTLLLGIGMGVAGTLLVPQILWILNCPPDIYTYTREYLSIYIAGITFTAFYNVGSAVLRSVGDSQSPFFALVMACVMNIFLDLFFVLALDLAVVGVALATVLSQMLSVLFVLYRMQHMEEAYAVHARDLKINGRLLKEVIAIGLPAGVQASLISISNMFVNRYINGFGSVYMAGVGVAQKIDRFVSMPCMSLGLAVTTFVSQNIGARKLGRVQRGIAICYLLSLVSILLLGTPIFFNASFLVELFNRDPGVIASGSTMMRVLIPCYFIMAANQIFSGVLRGFGYSAQVMIASVLGMIVFRQIFLYIAMAIKPSIFHIYLGYPIGWFFAALGVILLYLRYKKQAKLEPAYAELG